MNNIEDWACGGLKELTLSFVQRKAGGHNTCFSTKSHASRSSGFGSR